LRAVRNHITDVECLEFRNDAVRVGHGDAHKLLKPGVAVHAASLVPDLHQPGPDVGWPRFDSDGEGLDQVGVLDDVVAWHDASDFLVGGAPLTIQGADEAQVGSCGCGSRSHSCQS